MAVTKKRLPAADMSLLTEADLARIEKKAADKVVSERKKVAEDRHLEVLLEKERAKFEPELELVHVTIDLPAFAQYMLIDGVYYYHGDQVEVSNVVAASLREQMSHCWVHERLSGNPNLRDYKPVKEDSFSAHMVGNQGLARV